MRRQTQNRVYHVLPVVFWLLAILGTLAPAVYFNFLSSAFHFPPNYFWGYLVAAAVMLSVLIIGRIRRHQSSVEQCFLVAVLLGVASYWLPTVLFLILPIWIYLIYQNLFSLRSFSATFIGFGLVAVWAALFIRWGWIDIPWAHFFAKENAWGWIPTGAIIVAWFFSTIVRQNLRVR